VLGADIELAEAVPDSDLSHMSELVDGLGDFATPTRAGASWGFSRTSPHAGRRLDCRCLQSTYIGAGEKQSPARRPG
jgi:hypothetical protein